MKISEVIRQLERAKAEHGDIESQIQDNPGPGDTMISASSTIFVVAEEYDGGEMICNIRNWPY